MLYRRPGSTRWWGKFTIPGKKPARESSGTTDREQAREWHDRRAAELWRQHRAEPQRPDTASFGLLFSPRYVKTTFTLLLVNFFGMFAWWGLFTWIPPYLSLPVAEGGRGFGVFGTTTLLVVLNLFGMFPGYASFGWVADHLGRRRSFVAYLTVAALLVPLYALATGQSTLLILGVVVAFFGTGFFSGSGLVGSEVFPTHVRARALGFTYNGARALSSIAPFTIGYIGQQRGLNWAFMLCAASFLIAAAIATQLPETKGKSLE